MYSRFPRDSDRQIRLPEHYSGCAFTASPPPEDAIPLPAAFQVPSDDAPESPTASTDAPAADVPAAVPSPEPAPTEATGAAPIPLLPDGLRSLFGGRLPAFPGGMEFDELLLLGLILLLSHSEEQSDVILWLALLLFCK